MLEAVEQFPMNFGFLGKGHAATREPLAEQIAGAVGLKIHEDWDPPILSTNPQGC